jgi:hypothetical protein
MNDERQWPDTWGPLSGSEARSGLCLQHLSPAQNLTMFRCILALITAPLCLPALADSCTYSTYKWNVAQRQAVAHQRVSKPRSEINVAERDSETGCTVCEEDQVEIQPAGLRPFKVCKLLANSIGQAIAELQRQQAPLRDIVGYRVGMTRGDIDADGNRTGFSNHSFGVALDINTEQNGLYDNCYSFGPNCRLIKGGPWNPQNAGSLTTGSVIVTTFKRYGFRWGGEIAGKQKDFMHFSPTGY